MDVSSMFRWFPASIFLFSALSSNLVAAAELTTSGSQPPAVVIGFVGGFVRHNDTVHQEVQLAGRLRKEYPSGVEVRMFENHSGRQAHEEILRLLDADRDG